MPALLKSILRDACRKHSDDAGASLRQYSIGDTVDEQLREPGSSGKILQDSALPTYISTPVYGTMNSKHGMILQKEIRVFNEVVP